MKITIKLNKLLDQSSKILECEVVEDMLLPEDTHAEFIMPRTCNAS